MKKSPKKLALHRETLRFLEDSRVSGVKGGNLTYTCQNSCDTTPRSNCVGCDNYSNFKC